MKKALSLILAVLMLSGCLMFSTSAVETFYGPDIIDQYGLTGHISLTEKNKAVNVVPDGSETKNGSTVSGGWYHTVAEGFNYSVAYDDTYLYVTVAFTVKSNGAGLGDGKMEVNLKPSTAWTGDTMADAHGAWYPKDGYAGTKYSGAANRFMRFESTFVAGTGFTEGNAGYNANNQTYAANGATFETNGVYAAGEEASFTVKVARSSLLATFGGTDDLGYTLYIRSGYDNVLYGGGWLNDAAQTAVGSAAGYNHWDWLPIFITFDAPEVVPTESKNIVEILENNGVQHIYVPETTAVSMDGAITEGEYLMSNPWDYSIMQNELLVAGNCFARNYTEYFAYDDTYLYFAFTGDMFLNKTYNQYEQISLRPSSSGDLSAEEIQKNLVTGALSGAGDDYNWYQFKTIINGNISQALNYRTGADTDVFYTWSDGDSEIVSDVTDPANATVEIKINRKLLNAAWGYDDNTNVYAYYYRTPKANDNTIQPGIFGTPLTEAMKEEIGTEQNYAPRYIILGEEAAPATIDAASVRISTLENGTGLRFKTVVDKNRLAALQATYDEVTVGTLIAPVDTIGDGKTLATLTHAAGEAGVDYLDVPATVAEPFATTYNSNIYAGSITAIKSGNLERDFAAVGYIAVVDGGETTYYYTDTAVSRNADYVASAALADVKDASADGYTNEITDANDAYVGKYSPYTEAERAKLAALVVA